MKDLLEQGAARYEAYQAKLQTDIEGGSGGRSASYGRIHAPGQLDVTHGRILYLEDVSVSFDGFKAIQDLNLDIGVGELRCIIGPNGAGKTTMMDIITGKTRPDAGRVFFGSTIDLLGRSESDIANLGIGRKFQKPTVFEMLSVMDNLELAAKGHKSPWSAVRQTLNAELRQRMDEMLHTIHLQDHRHRLAGELSHGQKQWLEIGMLLMQEPKLLLLDEPVAGMTDQETERTAQLLLSLKGKHSMMVVEHDMSFVSAISDIVTVLAEGRVLAQGTMQEVQSNESVIEVYLGR